MNELGCNSHSHLLWALDQHFLILLIIALIYTNPKQCQGQVFYFKSCCSRYLLLFVYTYIKKIIMHVSLTIEKETTELTIYSTQKM